MQDPTRSGFNWEEETEKVWNEKIKEIEEDENINWGKTGSTEKLKETVLQLIENYRLEYPMIKQPIATEDKILCMVNSDSYETTLKMFIDLIWRDFDGNLVIEDYKSVTAFTDPEVLNPKYLIQAMCNYFGVWSKYGEKPIKAIFREVKKTKGSITMTKQALEELLTSKSIEIPLKAKKDDLVTLALRENALERPRVTQEVVIEFTKENIDVFFELLRRMNCELCGKLCIVDGIQRFLPNPFAMFSGQESWDDFVEEVTTGDIVINPEKEDDYISLFD